MKRSVHPMPVTIIFGLICGLSYIPMSMAMNSLVVWQLAFRLILWLYLVCYAFLLIRWGKRSGLLILVPLLLLFMISVVESSNTVFFLLCLGVFSWIRSSLCLQTSFLMMGVSEFILTLGGAALVAFWAPQTPLTWALGIWMFFLVQSLYFVFWKDRESAEDHQEEDPFERAYSQAERIVSSSFSV